MGVGEGPACLGAGRGDAPAPAGPRGPSALGTRLRLAGWGCLRQVSAHVTRHRSSQRRPFPNARCPCGGAAKGQERVPRSASESETRPALGRRLSQGQPRVWEEGVARPRPRHGWCSFRFSKHSVRSIDMCLAASFFTKCPSRHVVLVRTRREARSSSRLLLEKE